MLRCTYDEIAKHEASCTSQPGSGAGRFIGKHSNNRYQPYQTSWDCAQEAGRRCLGQNKPLAWRSFSNRGRSNHRRGRGSGAFAASGGSSKVAFPPAKTSGRKCLGSKLPSFLEPPLSGSLTNQQVVTHSGSEHFKLVPKGKVIQDGDARVHTAVPSTRRVSDFAGPQQHLLLHPHSPKIKEVSQVSLFRSDLPIQSASLWPVDSS